MRVYAAGKAGTSTFKKEVVDEYMSMLREYRALQDELTPWTTAFMEQNDRKPRCVRQTLSCLVTAAVEHEHRSTAAAITPSHPPFDPRPLPR